MASLAFVNWPAINSGGMVVMLGCSQVWLATSMPASAMRLAPSGLAATLLPIRKNVDWGVVVPEDLQQPVGVRAGAVVERQRHAFDLGAVDGGGLAAWHGP